MRWPGASACSWWTMSRCRPTTAVWFGRVTNGRHPIVIVRLTPEEGMAMATEGSLCSARSVRRRPCRGACGITRLKIAALALALALALAFAAGTASAQDAAVASALPEAAPAPTSIVRLQAGEYLWMPEMAPTGPVVLVISLPEQLLHVYRNGVRIGVSTVSTGKAGHETPTGVFSILQKRKEHYSNLYNNAPMPFMQRLTWDGIALHAGNLPGYPASHGCVR